MQTSRTAAAGDWWVVRNRAGRLESSRTAAAGDWWVVGPWAGLWKHVVPPRLMTGWRWGLETRCTTAAGNCVAAGPRAGGRPARGELLPLEEAHPVM